MEQLSLSGQELLTLFTPSQGENQHGLNPQEIKIMIAETRKYLHLLMPTEVDTENIRGGIHNFRGPAAPLIKSIGKTVAAITANHNLIRLPEFQVEKIALCQVLADSLFKSRGHLRFIAPVCPDYSGGDNYYRSMGHRISPEAQAAINVADFIMKAFPPLGFEPVLEILVANTEDDLPEVINNCAGGSVDSYDRSCLEAAVRVSEKLSDYPNATVTTFKAGLGPEFRSMQYTYEKIIRDAMESESNLRDRVVRIGKERTLKHSQILDRDEQGYELTTRYMAQYAALGTIARSYPEPVILLNYSTPNRAFYNASKNVSPRIIHSAEDLRIIPVLGTIVHR